MTAEPYRYHVQYTITPKPDGFTKADIPEDGTGAADALIIISLLYPPDGSYSALYMSRDGRTATPLDAREMFKAWIMWAARLKDDRSLSPMRRDFARTVFETFCENLMPPKPAVPL